MEVYLSKWQTLVWDDSHRYKVINVGRRSGKSTLSVLKVIDFAFNNPKSISWMVSPTYKQTKAIAWELFKTYTPLAIIDKTNETELIIKLKNGSHILLKGADNPDSLRGVRIDFCVFDETAFFDKWETVWKVIRPTLADSRADCWFISTPNGFNHFKKLYETQDDNWQSFHFTTYDNPYLDPHEIELMKAEMDEDSFAQEVMGEFRKMSGLIYKGFDRDIHMVDIPTDKFTEGWTFTRSLDFGFAHKTALGYFAMSPNKDEIYLYDGVYETGLFESQIADVVKEKDQKKAIVRPVADSAQPMSIAQLFHFGVRFDPVDKETDSVKNGIVRVAELLKVRKDTGKPTLMFNKNLTWIADEFEKYRWIENQSADGAIKEVPYKVDDDACFVADTMILTDQGLKPIEKIVGGDSVLTPFGKSLVLSAGCTGKKQVVDYGVFRCTPNHKIITNQGIVRVDMIRYTKICQTKENQKPYTFWEYLTDAILNRKTEQIDFIFKGLLTRKWGAKLDFYIEIYGNTIVGRYLKALKSIILTVILPTTRLTILNLSRMLNMLEDTIGGTGMDLKNIREESWSFLKNGTRPMRGENFTNASVQYHTTPEKLTLKDVKRAAKNLKHTFLTEANTVIQTVKPQHCGEEWVYNLATEDGMYFANGVLVSNCDMIRYFAITHTNRSQGETFVTQQKEKLGQESFVVSESGTIPAISIKDFIGEPDE